MSSGHVLARVIGFGCTVLPRAPYRLAQRAEGGVALEIRHGEREVVLLLRQGARSFTLGPGVTEVGQVVDVSDGPAHDHWRIETSVFSARWPDGFVLASSPDGSSMFDLFGPDDALMFLQGPFALERLPPLERLAAPGQAMVGIGVTSGVPFVELSYTHDGTPWRQWHHRIEHATTAVVLTTQVPLAHASAAHAASELLIGSLVRTR